MTADGNHVPSAEPLCDLYGKLAGRAGRTEDQNALSGNELRPRIESHPGGHSRIGGCGGGGIVQTVRQREREVPPGDCELRKSSERAAGTSEVDAGAISQLADAIDSGDKGKLAGASVVGAVGQCPDDGVKSGGRDRHQLLVFGYDWISKGGVSGRCTKGLDNGSVHREVLLQRR